MTEPERLDDGLTGNGESTSGDPVMQWGARFEDGLIEVERSQEAARLTVDFWTRRGVEAVLVSRVCGPWQ